ncbi:MAG: hypothetical protein SGARI_005777 [Bacillariaceae sp.]
MIQERLHFKEEAQEKSRKLLASKLLPWETLDQERQILVDECKEAILQLSKNEETFFGPYEMPFLTVQLQEDDKDEDGEDSDAVKDDDEEEDTAAAAAIRDSTETTSKQHNHNHHHNRKPSPESLEQLEKLQPLPPLLAENFDLDSHVGLIQLLLKEDPILVERQAALSGKRCTQYYNYCTTIVLSYEAGLSIDEIWPFYEEESGADNATTSKNAVEHGGATGTTTTPREEETVVFAESSSEAPPPPHAGFQDDDVDVSVDDTAAIVETETTTADHAGGLEHEQHSEDSGFEMIGGGDGAGVSGGGVPEMDELEAEIARELLED